jgi:hypothetical protein
MKPSHRMGRRKFLQNSAGLLGTSTLLPGASLPGSHATSLSAGGPQVSNFTMQSRLDPAATVWILLQPEAGFKEKLAARELARGLRNLGLAQEPRQAPLAGAQPGAADTVFSLLVGKERFRHHEAYEIALETGKPQGPRVRLTGAAAQATLYAVFDFLERQGTFYGLDGEVYPLEPARALHLPAPNQPWRSEPRFSVRGLVPWPDFLNCVTVFNREEWRAYLEAMLRMRFNTLGVHVYSGANQWTESFLSFEYAGAGHLAFTDTSATNRWGYLPEKTSRYGMGAADFYAGEVFGSEATTQARNSWEAEQFAQQLWGEAFRYARELGIRTGVGFEPYQVPDEIFRATPPEAHYSTPDPKLPGPRIDPESVAARDILEARLGSLLEAYPTLDYIWLWEDEEMSWASQNQNVPLSLTPFKQAYDFLRRHAPDKRLVISGWGGVVRHFAHFHRALPEDIIFTSLSDNLGWDPVSEEYAKLEGRERWPIPWLEDDPAMWLPQFHVHRWAQDMDRAEQFGCRGLLGIHWRHRIMDANAGFQSRFSWEKELTPTKYFQAFAAAHLLEPRAGELAKILDETDLSADGRILCSFTGEIKNGHHQIQAYSGDYDEAFQFWNGYEPPQKVKDSQARVAVQLRALTEAAQSPAERERLNYLTRHVEFLVPYSESWSLAFHLNQKLQQAKELKRQGNSEEAGRLIRAEGVPLWLKLAPLVREVLLDFQEIVSTRNDLGTLASMHNKYERLALFRLRASLKEFLGELPREIEQSWEEARRPDAQALPRVFIPTRPTLLRAGERVRILAIAPGPGTITAVTLFVRPAGARQLTDWSGTPMSLLGRRTFVADLQAQEADPPLLNYFVRATWDGAQHTTQATAPLGAPERFYTVTVM